VLIQEARMIRGKDLKKILIIILLAKKKDFE